VGISSLPPDLRADGTSDAEIVAVEGWRMAHGEAARRDVEAMSREPGRSAHLLTMLNLYPSWARPGEHP
jgi:hypothetical protein